MLLDPFRGKGVRRNLAETHQSGHPKVWTLDQRSKMVEVVRKCQRRRAGEAHVDNIQMRTIQKDASNILQLTTAGNAATERLIGLMVRAPLHSGSLCPIAEADQNSLL